MVEEHVQWQVLLIDSDDSPLSVFKRFQNRRTTMFGISCLHSTACTDKPQCVAQADIAIQAISNETALFCG